MPKQARELKEGPLRITQVFLAWRGRLTFKVDLSDLEWASQVRIGSLRPKMHPLKHEICHLGPTLGPLKSGVGSFKIGIVFSQAWDGPSSA